MKVEEILEFVEGLVNPETVDVGRLLFVQGAIMQQVGLKMLQGEDHSARKMALAVKILGGAESALGKAGSFIEKQPSISLMKERQQLLEMAYEKGYDIAFESDGRITLEIEDRNGVERLKIESV